MTQPYPNYFRRSVIGLVIILLLMPVFYWGAVHGVQQMFTSPSRWMPPGVEQRDRHEQFVEQFDVQDVMIVSWDGCTIDDPRLPQLADILLSECVADDGTPFSEFYVRVRTGYGVVRELQSEPLSLSREEAIDRLVGTLIGYDRRSSCAVIDLTTHATIDRRPPIETLYDVLEQDLGIPREQVYTGGTQVHGLAIDEESIATFDSFSIAYMVVSTIVCFVCLRSIPLTFAVMLVAGFGERLAVSTVYFTGTTMSAVQIVLSPLVFVLTVSAGVHLANYFRDESHHYDPAEAARRALAVGWLPCWLAALTTAIGLLSLTVSQIVPIRKFGMLAAFSLLVSVVFMFLVLPGIAQRWSRTGPASDAPRFINTLWAIWGRFIYRRAYAIVAVTVTLGVVVGYGVRWLETNVDILELLPSDHRVVQDSRRLENNQGALVPVELLVHFNGDEDVDLVERLFVLHDIQDAVMAHDDIYGSISALTFLPELPEVGGLRQTVRRSVFRSRVTGQIPRLIEAGYLRNSSDVQTWRFTVRTPAFGQRDYGALLRSLDARVQPILASYEQSGSGPTGLTLTGVMPVVHDAQRVLLRGLILSYSTAFALVAIVLMIALRSIRSALVAMIPNLLPTGLLLGAMGWLDYPIDIGSMMAASIGLGIAVDDTLHYMLWFRREVSLGQRPPVAMVRALRRCGTAMLQTTLIITLGVLVFMFSSFAPTRRFAMTICILLAAAIVGDLLMLPALLVGPFSGIFLRKRGVPVQLMGAAGMEPAKRKRASILTPPTLEKS